MSEPNEKVDMLYDLVKDFKQEVNNRFDKIESKLSTLVNKEDCKQNQEYCFQQISLKKNEMEVKKLEFDYKKWGLISGMCLAVVGLGTLIVKGIFSIPI